MSLSFRDYVALRLTAYELCPRSVYIKELQKHFGCTHSLETEDKVEEMKTILYLALLGCTLWSTVSAGGGES